MTITRYPAVAGLFYPADPDELRADVRRHLEAPAPKEPEPAPNLRALVVPHAGYIYSGPTAGVGYRLLPPLASTVRRVLLLGPPHFVPVHGLAVTSADTWASPLGRTTIDVEGRDWLSDLAAQRPDGASVHVSDTAHEPEHSLEVQLPFLLATLPDAAVLPVLVGQGPVDAAASLLEGWWADGALIVVSTDLSHYEPDWSAKQHDARTAEAILGADPDRIADHDACGARALRVLLTMARRRQATVRELDRRTSADTAGTADRVVGYGAFAVVD